MIVKAVTFFLIAILALGMFGKLRMPKIGKGTLAAKKCKSCGAYLIADKPCECTKTKR